MSEKECQNALCDRGSVLGVHFFPVFFFHYMVLSMDLPKIFVFRSVQIDEHACLNLNNSNIRRPIPIIFSQIACNIADYNNLSRNLQCAAPLLCGMGSSSKCSI